MSRCINNVVIILSITLAVNCVKPNFVLFLTDDQDLLLDGMLPMKNAIQYIGNKGITFQEAYVHSPICCPSRSSILTGKYLHNLHVFNNSISGNCSSTAWQQTHETRSIASVLKSEANYVNFYAGKYLNQYGQKEANGLKHIPPGYDWWYGLHGNSKYYNFTLSINGTGKHFNAVYLTDLMADFANDFLNNQLEEQPFFMILATPAAHAPFTSAPRHEDTYPGIKSKRTPAFNASVQNKHWLLHLPPEHLPPNVEVLDHIQRKRMQTLLSVDELVLKVVNKLEEQNLLDNTFLIFTSDNGYHIGQFGMPWDKRQLYQTDIKVPFLMSGPGISKKQLLQQPISLVDLAPTILDLAGVEIPSDMDGISFAHNILKTQVEIEDIQAENLEDHRLLYVRYFGEVNVESVDQYCNFSETDSINLSQCSRENWCKCQDARNNTYDCILDIASGRSFKYCLFDDNVEFVEAYDLLNDNFELNNINDSLTPEIHKFYQDLLDKFRKCTGKSCNISIQRKLHAED